MANGIDRMPKELRMSKADHKLARATTRWKVEKDKIDKHCSGMNPVFQSTDGNNIDAVDFTVTPNPETTSNAKTVRFRIKLFDLKDPSGRPSTYPNVLPLIYPLGWKIPKRTHDNHTWDDKQKNIHICTMYETQWNRDGTIGGLMMLAALWYYKYLEWEKTGKWPGLGQKHCKKCSQEISECRCR